VSVEERQQIVNVADSPTADVQVLLYAQHGGRAQVDDYRILHMEQGLADEFREFAKNFAGKIRHEMSEVTFQPGYDPQPSEVVRIPLGGAESARVRALRDRAQDPSDAALLAGEDDRFLDYLVFYAVVIRSDNDFVVFVRKFKPSMRMKKRRGVHLLLTQNTFARLEQEVFSFDKRFDCCIHGGRAFVHPDGLNDFLSIFDFYDRYKRVAAESVDAFASVMPFENLEEFKQAATSDPRLMRTMVAAQDHAPRLANVSLEEIQRVTEEYGYSGVVIKDPDNGQLQFAWERSPDKRWRLPNVLNDSLVVSVLLDDQHYVAPNKLRIERQTKKKTAKKKR
jgi:hypothetical protein